MHTSRVLILDDDRQRAEQMAAMLDGLGYQVAAIARDAEEALSLAACMALDLLLVRSDAALESRVSVEALQQHGLPMLFVGSEEHESLLLACLAAPFVLLLQPFSERDLRVHLELTLCKQARAQSLDEIEGFFAVAVDMFCILGFDGYFRRLNPAWERTLGFTAKELMSRRFIEFVHPDDRERTLAQNAEVRAGGRAIGFENRYLCKDGSFRWLRWNATPQSLDGVIYSVARDVTERKQAEDERSKLLRVLKASLAEVKALQSILPICMYCKNVRDDQNYWQSVDKYLAEHTSTRFSHGICPSCMASVVGPQMEALDQDMESE